MVPVSNGYLYRCRVGEIGENAKRQNGTNECLLISLLKLNKRHVLLYLFNLVVVVCKEYYLAF